MAFVLQLLSPLQPDVLHTGTLGTGTYNPSKQTKTGFLEGKLPEPRVRTEGNHRYVGPTNDPCIHTHKYILFYAHEKCWSSSPAAGQQ